METIKMRIVNSEEFRHAVTCCCLAFGCFVEYKRTLVWFDTFHAGDGDVIIETLKEFGSICVRRIRES